MKFKFILVLAGTIASLSLATALPASAQFGNFGDDSKHQELVSTLGLTEEQQARVSELRADMRSQMSTILTAEQKSTLQNARSGGERPGRGTIRSLNLTTEQRQQMRALHQDFQADLEDILTEEQVQKLDDLRQSRRSFRR